MKKIFTLLLWSMSLFATAQTYTIAGIVKDESNRPVSKATVTLIKLSSNIPVVTNSKGSFLINTDLLLLNDSIEIKLPESDKQIRFQINETMSNLDIDSGAIKISKLNIVRHNAGGYPFDNNGGTIVKKPVIYLYPAKKETVSVEVNFNGSIGTTYPLYNGKWIVDAYPDGHLINSSDNKEYYYLFWDGKFKYDRSHLNFNDGFIVSAKDALVFLQNSLTAIGLNAKEQNDFIVFWLPELQRHSYTYIHFRLNDDCAYFSTNTVIPKPESVLRVIMEFKPVNKYISIKPQILPEFKRTGFSLVEWGGIELTDDISIGNQKF
jgi:hypothetical protein